MKKLSLLSIMALLMMAFASHANAELTSPWKHSFTGNEIPQSAPPTTATSVTLSDVEWTCKAEYYKTATIGSNNNTSLYFGTKNGGPIKVVDFYTTAFQGYKITKVTVETWALNSLKPTLTCSVSNGEEVKFTGSREVAATSASGSSYTFEPNAQGEELRLNWLKATDPGTKSSYQLNIRSIAVEFEAAEPEDPNAPKLTPPNVTLSESGNKLAINKGTVTIKTTYEGGVTYYSIGDTSDPKTEGKEYTAPFTFDTPGVKIIRCQTKFTQDSKDYWSSATRQRVFVYDPSITVDVINQNTIHEESDHEVGTPYAHHSYNAQSGNTYQVHSDQQNGTSDIAFNNNSTRQCGLQIEDSRGCYVRSITFKSLYSTKANMDLQIYGSNNAYGTEFPAANSKQEGEQLLLEVRATSTASDHTVLIPGDYKYISIRPRIQGVVRVNEFTVTLDANPSGYISDIFNIETRKINDAYASSPTVTITGYLYIISVNQEARTAYAQDPKGHTMMLRFDDIDGIEKDMVLRGLVMVPSVENGLLVGSVESLLSCEDYLDDPAVITTIDLPLNEKIIPTHTDLTNEADWSAFAVGKAVTYSGEFDDISAANISGENIDYTAFHQYITLNGGKVKFVHNHFGANAEALKAMNRHIWLTAHPEAKTDNDNDGFKLEGILVPATPAASGAAVYAAPAHTAEFLATKATTAGGGTITGIEDITASDDENAPAEYFNLMGVKVSNPVSGSLYIVRQGSKVTKQIAD